jgi:hypothetical protein
VQKVYICITNQKNNFMKQFQEVQLPIVHETESAVCFNTYAGYCDMYKKVWIPKSQMIIKDTECGDGTLIKQYFVKNWLIKKL